MIFMTACSRHENPGRENRRSPRWQSSPVSPSFAGPQSGKRPAFRIALLADLRVWSAIGKYHRPKIKFKDQEMSHATRIAIVTAFVAVLGGVSSEASARGRLYPLTRCGPDLAYLCPIHGYFDSAPFHYSLAVYPGCIKTIRVETPDGVKRQRAIVCG